MTIAPSPGMLRRMCGRLSLARLLAALLLTSCGSGTETGNPTLTGALSYTGYSSRPEEIGVRRAASTATIDNAWFDLERVTVSQRGGCGIDGAESFEIPALGLGDHATGKHNFTTFVGPQAAFCNVELPFAAVSEQTPGAPDRLRGHALLLEGTLADGTPFSLVSDTAPSLLLSAEPGGFELERGRSEALIAFDFANWLEDVDFASAKRESGRIMISATENGALLAAFEAKLGSGVALYRDSDGDGVLDAEPELLARAR